MENLAGRPIDFGDIKINGIGSLLNCQWLNDVIWLVNDTLTTQ